MSHVEFYQHLLSSLKLLSSPAVPASKSYTVAIIKPDAVAHGKANEIIMKVHRDQHCSHSGRTWSSQAFLLILFHYVDMTLPPRFKTLGLRSWPMRNAHWPRLRHEIFTSTKQQRYDVVTWMNRIIGWIVNPVLKLSQALLHHLKLSKVYLSKLRII